MRSALRGSHMIQPNKDKPVNLKIKATLVSVSSQRW